MLNKFDKSNVLIAYVYHENRNNYSLSLLYVASCVNVVHCKRKKKTQNEQKVKKKKPKPFTNSNKMIYRVKIVKWKLNCVRSRTRASDLCR